MASLATLTPRLERTLVKLKKQERGFSGKLQNLSNVWLRRLEAQSFLKPGGFLRKNRSLYRTQPAIDLDSLFPFSLVLHLALFFLLLQISVKSRVTIEETPVVVRIMNLPEAPPQPTRETAKSPAVKAPRPAPRAASAPPPAKTPVEQKAPAPPPTTRQAPASAPALPGPKKLAEAPRANRPVTGLSSAKSLVQLPTRESGSAHSTRSDDGNLADATSAGQAVVAVPQGLRRADTSVTVGAASRSTPTVLSSPDFAPYLEMIKKRVQSVWKYPDGMTGSHRINVIFALDRAGTLVRAEVADSTDPRLNNSALQAMRTASPFPPIPESLKELSGAPLRMRFNIDIGIKAAK